MSVCFTQTVLCLSYKNNKGDAAVSNYNAKIKWKLLYFNLNLHFFFKTKFVKFNIEVNKLIEYACMYNRVTGLLIFLFDFK